MSSADRPEPSTPAEARVAKPRDARPGAASLATLPPVEYVAPLSSRPSGSRRPVVPGYEVITELGSDGVSVVYKARQIQPDRLVALKMILRADPVSAEQTWGQSETIGPAADIYALGAILYECLTGWPPFKGVTIQDTVE